MLGEQTAPGEEILSLFKKGIPRTCSSGKRADPMAVPPFPQLLLLESSDTNCHCPRG